MLDAYKDPPPPVTLGVTHFRVPVTFTQGDQPLEDFLSECFHFFNWVDRNFEAPIDVNEFAGRSRTHASMSVGDVVEVRGVYYICRPFGWDKMENIGHKDCFAVLGPVEMNTDGTF